MAMVWNNLTPMIAWGRHRAGAVRRQRRDGLLGFIVIFPLLGHATWHAYRAMS